MAAIISGVLQIVECPLCGHSEYEVVKPAQYASDVSVEELRTVYKASSKDRLADQLVRCSHCSLHYVNPRPPADLIAQSYASAVDGKFVAQNPGRIRSFRRVLRGVLRSQGRTDGNGLKLLDVGCAGGASLVAARSLGLDSVGVEPSRWMADFGRRSYGVRILDGLLQPGMFSPGSFDVITLWDVLEHAPEPAALLRLIHSLLRDDGVFVLSYPDLTARMARLLGNKWPFWLSVHLLYYDRTTIARQLHSCGFAVQHMKPYWMTLELGYIFERAEPYLPLARVLGAVVRRLGLGRMLMSYSIGQVVVLARKADFPNLHQ